MTTAQATSASRSVPIIQFAELIASLTDSPEDSVSTM